MQEPPPLLPADLSVECTRLPDHTVRPRLKLFLRDLVTAIVLSQAGALRSAACRGRPQPDLALQDQAAGAAAQNCWPLRQTGAAPCYPRVAGEGLTRPPLRGRSEGAEDRATPALWPVRERGAAVWPAPRSQPAQHDGAGAVLCARVWKERVPCSVTSRAGRASAGAQCAAAGSELLLLVTCAAEHRG